MTARLNRYLLDQTRHDSGALVQPDFVVHPCVVAGRHQVDVYRLGKQVTSVMLDVDAGHVDMQVSIDLAALEQPTKKGDCCCDEKTPSYRVGLKGYALFYVGSGSGGYAVRVNPLSSQQETASFNSQQLQKSDLFGTTLLRPGKYSLVDKAAKISLPLYVEPVRPGKAPYVPPDALHFDIADLRKLKEIRMQQAQGIVIRAEKDNHIVIVLEDDANGGGNEPPRQVARMTRARAASRKG